MDIHGRAYEMYYVDELGDIGIAYLSPMDAFMIYDDSILERPMFFVRTYIDENKVEWGSWSDGRVVQHFVHNGSYQWIGAPRVHGFDGVPAVEYLNNDERMGLFEDALPAINAYNKALSEKCNDVEYFADAYLKVLGARLEDKDLVHIRRNRIIQFDDVLDDAEKVVVDFLQKPDADATQEHLLDRLERQIFAMSMVANINDESFGTASGIALRYRMASMNNLAQAKERKFTAGLSQRYRLIFSNPIARANGVGEDDWMRISYHFTRNFPANVGDEAETAAKLDGIVSKETQLKVLSVVDSPDAELERIAAEEEAAREAASSRVWRDPVTGDDAAE